MFPAADIHVLTIICSSGKKLNGIIYMHRISDPWTGRIAKKNLHMFKELCGEKMLTNVLIVTTNWSCIGEEEGDQ